MFGTNEMVRNNLKGLDMIKKLISLIAAIMMVSLTVQAGYEYQNSGFTVTTIALDAANVQVEERQSEEDSNASIEGDTSEK